ncbi:MAG: hypothetical protein M0Q38_15675 [Bacteroidales bacterium]|jgi:predicted extracellular nuclease|nr:hypothetical protein [Bacteroidales bacterium]
MKAAFSFLLLGLIGFVAPGLILSKSHWISKVENHANLDSLKITSQNVRIVFWNVENLYDPYDDSTKLDDEFTSRGAMHWTFSKFRIKLNHVAKTLLSIGGWEAPVIVGMCEVENRYVMNKLIYETPLKAWKYKFIHHESPDLRGVDVALLYRPDRFKPIFSRSVSIRFPFDTLSQTREILLVQGILSGNDTLTLFVNHWPSRRGGTLESQPRRNYVASVLRCLIDSIQMNTRGLQPEAKNNFQPSIIKHNASVPGGTTCKLSNILIMGDFNDEPYSESLLELLGARSDSAMAGDCDLVNLMAPKTSREGSHKFRGQWSILDQFIISKTLLLGKNGLLVNYQDAHIYKAGFLLNEDPAYFGDKPSRTYVGPRYTGGFSDHLPVYLDIRNIWH